jgi:hypothetical protein
MEVQEEKHISRMESGSDESDRQLFRFYKIKNSKTNDTYVGRTIKTLQVCMKKHTSTHMGLSKDCPLYEKMREVGVSQFSIELLKEVLCTNKEALQLHKKYIDELKPTLNKVPPVMSEEVKAERSQNRGRVSKRWREENKDKIREYSRNHYQKNREGELERRQKYSKKAKTEKKYYCEVCDYAAGMKIALTRHFESVKHKKAAGLV